MTAKGLTDKDGRGSDSSLSGRNPVVSLVGDVMFDAALYYKSYARKQKFDLPKEFILATIHRAENTDDLARLNSIFAGFEKIGNEIPIILPLHTRTRKTMADWGIGFSNSIKVTNPVSYLEIIHLLENCSLVMTDSGGLQKEAFFFKKPCITLRDETEWVELVECGCNFLAGATAENIYEAFQNIAEADMNFDTELYGDGKAGVRILEQLRRFSH